MGIFSLGSNQTPLGGTSFPRDDMFPEGAHYQGGGGWTEP